MPPATGTPQAPEAGAAAGKILRAMREASDLRSAHAAFQAWMFELALPFWAGAGHDAARGGAYEHLRLDGAPAEVTYKRMRVQARQIYAFSHAALLGWPQGEALARGGYRFITRVGERPEGRWVRRLTPDGRAALDPAADLYDQAFVLFALAWYARLTGDGEALQRARRTVEWLRAAMAFPPQGFHNVVPPEPGPRQQNPHMHLLEAALALYETSGDSLYAELAHELFALFEQRLFDAASGTLGEFFNDDWSPAPGQAGDHVEPGHHFEWTWLLDQYQRLTGGNASRPLAALYQTAVAHGVDPEIGLIWDAIDRSGAARQRSTRLWPQTEALKAHAVLSRRGDDQAVSRIVQGVRNLGSRFFTGCPEGAWLDQFDAEGRPSVDKIPTSSFYHVFMAFAEVDALARQAG